MFALFYKKGNKHKFYAAFHERESVDLEQMHRKKTGADELRVEDIPNFDFNMIDQYEEKLNGNSKTHI